MYNKKIPIDISCGFRIAIEVMGGKWKPYIIYELLDGPKRPRIKHESSQIGHELLINN